MADTPAAPADVSVTPAYLDKGLWVAVLTPILAILNQKFGWALDSVAIVGVMLPLVAFILGHKWKSSNIAVAQVQAAAAAKDPGPTLNS
jgi:hypothetical protein